MHFTAIARVPGDPILGLLEAYAQDPNPHKFDLGVGVYKDAQGLTPILRSVKLAEQKLVDGQPSKSYIGGHGDLRFGSLLCELVMGTDSGDPDPGRHRRPAPERGFHRPVPAGARHLAQRSDLADPRDHLQRRRPENQPLPLCRRGQPSECRRHARRTGAGPQR